MKRISNLNKQLQKKIFLPLDEAIIIKNIAKFVPFEYTLTTNLKDSMDFSYLRDDSEMHFCINDNHISEIEILSYGGFSDECLRALLQVKDLKYLRELGIYCDKNFIKSLNNFNNLEYELLELLEEYES